MEKCSRDFKGVWIPKEIWLNNDLTLQEKCLVVEIDSYKECWKSNQALAAFLNISKERVRKIINKLTTDGVLKTKVITDPETKQVIKRILKVSDEFKRNLTGTQDNHTMVENDHTLGSETTIPYGQKQPYPMVENDQPLWSETTTPYGQKRPVRVIQESNTVRVIQESNTKERGSKPPVFEPPTVDQVRKYCEERSNQVDPESFVDFYKSKGWLVGKTKMKDWQAAVRTWEKREERKPRPWLRQNSKQEAISTVQRLAAKYAAKEELG